MSNTIEDLIRDIIHYETEEAREDMKQEIIEDISLEATIEELEKRIKVLEERLEEAND